MPFIEFILSALTVINYYDEERYSNTRNHVKSFFIKTWPCSVSDVFLQILHILSNNLASMGKVLLGVYLGIQNRRRLRGMRNRGAFMQ